MNISKEKDLVYNAVEITYCHYNDKLVFPQRHLLEASTYK